MGKKALQSVLQCFNLTKICSTMQKWPIIAFGVIVCPSATVLHDTRQSWIDDDDETMKQLSWWRCVHVFVFFLDLPSRLTDTPFARQHRVCLCSLTEIWMAHIRDGTKKRRSKPASGASCTIKRIQRKTHTHWVPASGSQLRWGTRQPDFLFISSTSPPPQSPTLLRCTPFSLLQHIIPSDVCVASLSYRTESHDGTES